MSAKQWYVLQTKCRHENTAVQNLNNQNFMTFVPMMRMQKHSRGKLVSVCEPMFPGYLFIELDLEKDNTAPIRSTRGVIGLVRLGATLQPFPENLLNALMTAQATTGDAIEPAELFDVGEEVSLISGPMAGLRAIFKSHNSRERVVILLNILGTQTQVLVSPYQIAKSA